MHKIIKKIILNLKSVLWYKFFFKEFGKHSILEKPLKINRANNISIGSQVSIGKGAWLHSIGRKGSSFIQIGNRAQIGHFSHIVSGYNVSIGERCLIADRVFVSDLNHEYEEITLAVIDQSLKISNGVSIGEDSWIGEGACILKNVGKHCIIGCNSVVTHSIPDYCVAVGNPAKIIKQYDFNINEWVEIEN